MKKFLSASAVLALLGVSVTMSVLAQPPGEDRPDGPPPGGDRPDGPQPGRRGDGGPGQEGRPPMPPPLVAALDKDGDREISTEEIKEASASLLTLDKNGDGKLTDDEIRPPRPEGGGPGGPPGGGGGAGRGGFPPGGPDGARLRDFPPGFRSDAGFGDVPPGRGPTGPRNPERFVEDALRFDADGDGKLDKTELTAFAVEMQARQGRPPEGGPGRGPDRPDGERPPGDCPDGDQPK